jgi:hypothetical protein
LRHPLRTAKASASVYCLSGGRLVLVVELEGRVVEFMQLSYGEMFGVTDLDTQARQSPADAGDRDSGQLMECIACNSDGRITYPRVLKLQAEIVARWQAAVTAYAPGVCKPFVQSLYIVMAEHPDHPPSPIHLSLRAGCNLIL